MLDLLIRAGSVVDGTGRARFTGDVGIRDGRIVCVGGVDEAARETLDAAGLVVAPGFIDIHTHYDAQVFWDGSLSPSPLHGVTTVIGGNCGFSIAPLSDQSGDYMMRMLARVEAMPLESLREGVPWNWRSFGEYLDCLEGRVGPNAGFLVGHSALRRHVMGARTDQLASPGDIDAMSALLSKSPAAGGLGRLDGAGELAMMKLLAGWPRVVESAAEAHEPHRVAYFLMEFAASFHGFWARGNEDEGLRFIVPADAALTLARLALARAAAVVIASGLAVMGDEPVEEMR